MPSVQELKSKNARAVHEKHLDLIGKYQSHYSAVEQLHKLAKDQVVENVASQLGLNEEGKTRVLLYLSDFANLFRFYRRSRYDHDQAVALLNATLLWRMRTDLDLLSLSSLNPLYVTPPPPNPPLFWVNSHFKDFYGRPCGVINLRSVERTAEGTLDQLKEYIVACMEMMRRYVADLYRASTDGHQQQHHHDARDKGQETVLQASIAVDLASSGMANLELELLPFLLDLLKNHVPGMVGAVYVLNYGWVHAGMWAVIKRVLPQQALAKIFFPSYDELKEHFDVKSIPACYGGELNLAVESSTNDVLRKYGRPRRASNATPTTSTSTATAASPPHSPVLSRHMSRTNSYDSIYEVFYSADSTPWASRPITPRHSEPSTPRGNGSDANAAGGLKMTPGAARKLKHLQMSRGDLSSAAENAHSGGRSRSGSEVKIVDGKAVGLSVSVSASPFATPSITPVGPLSPRVTRTRNTDRHVRFSSDRSVSPQRRVGATSNFTLYLPQEDEEAVLPSESEDSDASGKDGELPPIASATGGLLNRLRRLSETRFTSKDTISDIAQKGEQPTAEAADGTIMYIEPSSPRLQVELFDEPPLQHVPHTFLSHRTRRSKRDGLVSPYNANNPFFGYPAYNPTAPEATFRLNPSATPQHLHSRRRKRDLLRTLTYLFVLRILAFHRRLRWRMSLVWRELGRTLSVGPRIGGGEGGEDDFWRNLDMKRLTAVQENERRMKMGKAKGPLGKVVKKLMGAVVLVMLLRPEWRQRTMLQVYATFGSMLGRREVRGEVNWDEWDKRGVTATAKQGKSWTGMHLRQRMGLIQSDADTKTISRSVDVTTAATGSGPGKRGQSSRVNPLAVAGGLISAASLGYLLYTYLSTSSNKKDDDDVAGRRSTVTKPSSSCPRPSLSLTLSSTFVREPTSISGLRTLLTTICPLFVVHLIVPGSPDDDLAASIQQLSSALGTIADFDTRRILEYTQSSGRFALSRALACDCHVEVTLPGSEEEGTVTELIKVKRSCGLVVFASFEEGHGGGKAVLSELRALAEAGRDAPNGMRAFDLGGQGWSVLASKLEELREGWR